MACLRPDRKRWLSTPAAIDQYRRCAELARELGKPAEEVRLFARVGLGRSLAAAPRQVTPHGDVVEDYQVLMSL